jgi:hypothetical protein
MRAQIFLHSKRSLLVCLLAAIFLSGCGAAKTPTAIPAVLSTLDPSKTKAPCVNISVSNTTPKVGEVIAVIGTLTGVVNPNYFGLEIKDKDADDSSMMINLLSKPPLKAADVSQVVQMVSADYANEKAVVQLKAVNAGVTDLNYFVSAENFCGVQLGNGVSPKITVTVNP